MLGLLGAGLGLVGAVGNIFGAGRANRRLNQLMKKNPIYKENPIAAQRLGLAQQLLNARQPGAAALERNIYGNQATTLAQVNRNSTDASQALALAAGVQGQTNQAFNQLGIQEGQDYYNRLNNLNSAQDAKIAEGDKVFQDQVRRFNDMAAIRGAQTQNTANAFSTVSNLGFGLMNFGLSGGGNALFGGGNSGQTGSGSMPIYGQDSNLSSLPLNRSVSNPYTPNTGIIPLPQINR